jgi:hypothetical protein
MGGNLSLVAEFPDRAPVVLSGIAEDGPAPKEPVESETPIGPVFGAIPLEPELAFTDSVASGERLSRGGGCQDFV